MRGQRWCIRFDQGALPRSCRWCKTTACHPPCWAHAAKSSRASTVPWGTRRCARRVRRQSDLMINRSTNKSHLSRSNGNASLNPDWHTLALRDQPIWRNCLSKTSFRREHEVLLRAARAEPGFVTRLKEPRVASGHSPHREFAWCPNIAAIRLS
jgi:hypothetical protein